MSLMCFGGLLQLRHMGILSATTMRGHFENTLAEKEVFVWQGDFHCWVKWTGDGVWLVDL